MAERDKRTGMVKFPKKLFSKSTGPLDACVPRCLGIGLRCISVIYNESGSILNDITSVSCEMKYTYKYMIGKRIERRRRDGKH